ncbi:hypothetical protein EMCRGX_G018276 [Ephydatia muelleri]
MFPWANGYYRKFIPDYASIAASLTDLTRKTSPNQVVWNERCEASFKRLKDLLCSAPVLQSPDFERDFVLQTDASDVGVGAVLSQVDDTGADHPNANVTFQISWLEELPVLYQKVCSVCTLPIFIKTTTYLKLSSNDDDCLIARLPEDVLQGHMSYY